MEDALCLEILHGAPEHLFLAHGMNRHHVFAPWSGITVGDCDPGRMDLMSSSAATGLFSMITAVLGSQDSIDPRQKRFAQKFQIILYHAVLDKLPGFQE